MWPNSCATTASCSKGARRVKIPSVTTNWGACSVPAKARACCDPAIERHSLTTGTRTRIRWASSATRFKNSPSSTRGRLTPLTRRQIGGDSTGRVAIRQIAVAIAAIQTLASAIPSKAASAAHTASGSDCNSPRAAATHNRRTTEPAASARLRDRLRR